MEETAMVPCFKMKHPMLWYLQPRQWRTSRYTCLLQIISFHWPALWGKISRLTTCTFDYMSLIFQKSIRNRCILILCLLRKPGIPLKLCSIISACSSSLVFSFPKRKESRDSDHISCYSVLAVIPVKFKSFSFSSDKAPPTFHVTVKDNDY